MKRNERLLRVVAVALMSVAILAIPAASQPALDEEDVQSLTLYGWIFGQSGNITARGTEANVDVSISDALDAMENLDGLFVMHYENRRGPRTLFADVMYARIKSQASTPLGDATFEPSTLLAELGWAVRTNKIVKPDGRASTAEWLVGLRYTDLKLDLVGPLGVIDVTGEQQWVDLFVGGRVSGDISDRWGYWVRGDIGGFGIGSSSHFVWNLILGLDYEMSRQWELELGWRWLDYNYSTGSGDTEFGYDVLNSGPFIGFTYSF